ncbi:hypothetical protein J437_LFUL001418 [Ladona fulva]|uniref:RNA helicase n=1 Tax=Ladona fulva TaxID=123851 RepID=A0A8K0JT55_LADFU|nr:hypothetical protein J437_LFUL001418 [Ladona fulva]
MDEALMKAIRKSEYSQPTPIQAQAVPAGLSGRDLIGIAKTGSGKTAAFIWPMLVHIMDQKELEPGDGPIGLILAPTRELSQQNINFLVSKANQMRRSEYISEMSYHRGGDGRPRGFGFSGFQLKRDSKGQLPPPPTSAVSKHGYSTMNAISQNALAASYGLPRKRPKTEEEYFEEDDETPTTTPSLEYIPAPGSPSFQQKEDSDSEEDPLDAYMAGIENQVKKQTTSHDEREEKDKDKLKKGIRDDIEEEDDEESYYRYMEENPNAGVVDDESDQEIEYDEDGNPIAPKKSKYIDPLPPIDHSTVEYADFEKNFYNVHEEIKSLTPQVVNELRAKLGIKIYQEAKKFGKVYNIQVVCCYGGGSKWEQSKALEGGAEIVVATPGRMIDLVKMKATNLARVTFLVLDEADRMFDMGFEPQVRSICNHVRPDRQTLLFSATFKKRVEKLARDVLTDPIRIGDVGEANQDITQIVKVVNLGGAKWNWLLNHIVEFLSLGSILIFVTKKANADELANNLKLKEFEVVLLHGDMDQTERNKVITQFKKKEVQILVATDVAARGLDIHHIRTVVNFDVARDIDTHTHRIGRTGRAGEKGTAYTLVTEKDKEFAGHLVRNLEGVNQEVPKELMDLAMQATAGIKMGSSLPSTGPLGTPTSETAPRRTGPGSDRLSAMKAAFRAQYQSQFTASTDESWQQTRHQPPPPPPPPPVPPSGSDSANNGRPAGEREKRRKSRWDQ